MSEVIKGLSGFVEVRDWRREGRRPRRMVLRTELTGLRGRIATGFSAYRSPAQDIRMQKVMGLQEASSKPRLPV